jgi:hypothetical protein
LHIRFISFLIDLSYDKEDANYLNLLFVNYLTPILYFSHKNASMG